MVTFTQQQGENLLLIHYLDKSYLTKSDNIQIGSGKKDFPVLYFIENDAVIPKQIKRQIPNNVIEELQNSFFTSRTKCSRERCQEGC